MRRYNSTFKDSGRPPNRPDTKVEMANLCKASIGVSRSRVGDTDYVHGVGELGLNQQLNTRPAAAILLSIAQR